MFSPLLATIQNVHETTHEAAQHVATHGAEVAEHMDFLSYIFHSNIINMLIVAGFLIWVAKKTDAVSVLKNRQEQVKQSVIKAEEEKKQAENNLLQAKEEVKDLDNKVNKIISDAKVSADSVHQKIQNDTTKKVEEIAKNLGRMIEVEQKSAANEIESSLSKEAYELATSKIKDALNDELHHKYINNFIDSLDEEKVK